MRNPILYNESYSKLSAEENILLDKSLEYIKSFVENSPKISNVNYATRDAHAKTYAYIDSIFKPSQDPLVQSIFTKDKYNAIVRVSHAHIKIISTDKQLPLYGNSFKIILDNQKEINLPLVNFPVFVTNSVSNFLKIFNEVNQLFTNSLIQKPNHLVEIISNLIPVGFETMNKDFIKSINQWRKMYSYFIFSRNYHSIGAYKIGNYMMKIKAVPQLFHPEFDEGETINETIQNYLKKYSFKFKLFYQLSYDEDDQPINNLLKIWKNSPDIEFGTFEFNNVIAETLEMENLSFNPFDNIDELLPVGKIQQLRQKIYETSINARKNINNQSKF